MKITVCMATRGSDIYYKVVDWLLAYTQNRPSDWDLKVMLCMSPYSAAEGQEKLFVDALNNGSDYLFIMDSDVCPPIGCIEHMISDDKDVVIAPVWSYDSGQFDIHLMVCKEPTLKIRTYKMGVGIEEICGGGFGSVLIKRHVLQEFANRREPFMMRSNLLGIEQFDLMPDNIFFSKCRKLGFKIWVDWDIKPTYHYRYVELCDNTIDNIVKMRSA